MRLVFIYSENWEKCRDMFNVMFVNIKRLILFVK